MDTYNFFHSTNIVAHVIAGTIALLLGIITHSSQKGKNIHKKAGRLFLLSLLFVISTGLIGVFVFGRNNFLKTT
jgi:uncharacterized membrane protein